MMEGNGREGLSGSLAYEPGHGSGVRGPNTEILLRDMEAREENLQNLEEEISARNLSLCSLISSSSEFDSRKADLSAEIRQTENTLKNKGLHGVVERLNSTLSVLKDLECYELEFMLSYKSQSRNMEKFLLDIEKRVLDHDKEERHGSLLDCLLSDAQEKLNLAKRELGARQRAIFCLQRQLGDFPVQSELSQYKHQFSLLHLQIQEKLQKTRQHYNTYNALVERKELMLKELSLLNSISSQFQAVIMENSCRLKLVDSMEGILTGTQQKLKKVESVLHEEQRIRDFFQEKYSTAVAERRHFSSLLQSIQEERLRNERLRAQMPL